VLNAAPLLQLFRDHGYATIANAQAWEEPSIRNVDVFVDGSGMNELERYLLRATLIGAIWEVIDRGLDASLMVPWVTDALAFLEQSSDIETSQPRLVFAHVPSPHFPIVFAADGSRAPNVFSTRHPDQVDALPDGVTAAYLGQVEFLNRQLLDTIDAMQLPEDAVVILMSDHGPEFGLQWFDQAETDFEVRFASFFAARNADGVFRDDVFVTEVLSALAGGLLGEPTEAPERRFYSSHGVEKLSTLTEVADPWR
jgi:arylsulfatase A-like enzyme